MGLPDGWKSFKVGLASHPASRVAVASTRYAYLRRAVKMESLRVSIALNTFC